MDPDACLELIQELVSGLIKMIDAGPEDGQGPSVPPEQWADFEDRVNNLLDLWTSLNMWMTKGGFIPKAWRKYKRDPLPNSPPEWDHRLQVPIQIQGLELFTDAALASSYAPGETVTVPEGVWNVAAVTVLQEGVVLKLTKEPVLVHLPVSEVRKALELVMDKEELPLNATIEKWTREQRHQAREWAFHVEEVRRNRGGKLLRTPDFLKG